MASDGRPVDVGHGPVTLAEDDTDATSQPPTVTYVVNWTVEQKQKKMRNVPEDEFDAINVEHAESAIEVRRSVEYASDEKSVLAMGSAEMRIYSQHLLAIIPEVVGYYPSYSLRGHRDPSRGPVPYLEIASPYRMISGARDSLTEVKKRFQAILDKDQGKKEVEKARITIDHIDALERELEKLDGPIKEEKGLHKLDTPMATFDMLWLLFRPGTVVLTKVSGEWAAAKVYLPIWGGEGPKSKSYLELITWYHDFDGTHLRRRRHRVRIERFEGRCQVKLLQAYPITYGDQVLLETLTRRGKAYYALLRETTPQRSYDGMLITKEDELLQQTTQSHSAHAHELNFPKKHYKGTVIADPFLFATEFGMPRDITWLDDTDIRVGSQDEHEMRAISKIDPRGEDTKELPSDHYYMMLPQWIRGFAVNTRLWAKFDVSHMETYPRKQQMIESLVIDEEKLDIIKAITKPRLQRENPPDASRWYSFNVEQVEGKGEGRVILLHGPPGTGKTFTAECIAEWTGRPLLRMTCGELGLNPMQLEVKLWRWFRMAEAWQAVLLIDEADVYVAKRLPKSAGTSLERETIVAVFLRALEYYKGILFLTTNSVLGFDPAITTRATLIIELDLPNESQRKKVCKIMEERIRKELKYDFRMSAKDELKMIICGDKTHRWNNREITNVYRVAIALAQQERDAGKMDEVRLEGHHIELAMKNVLDFAKYQYVAREESAEDTARADGRYLSPSSTKVAEPFTP
ncbi:hypothetical protein F5B19DRAFT_437873 [Rostrohypoxylon terebratum]|nr:hypothetical protein F5B19DRAFT_437873 [Rostrohypoxylon terebratum]